MHVEGIARLNAKLDIALAGLEHLFDPQLSLRLDKLLKLEEGAKTPSERAFWRNLREQESDGILDIGGAKYGIRGNSEAL